LALIAVALLAVAGGVTAAVLATSSGHGSGARATNSGSFSSAQQTRLERGLTASSFTKQASVLAVEIRDRFLAKDQPLLPARSSLHIQPATFKATSPWTAKVQATVTGSRPRHWLLLLIKEGENWLLIGTRRLG